MTSNVDERPFGGFWFGGPLPVLLLLFLSCFPLSCANSDGPTERGNAAQAREAERDVILIENDKLKNERDALLAEREAHLTEKKGAKEAIARSVEQVALFEKKLHHQVLISSELREQLEEIERCYADLRDQNQRIDKDRLAVAEQLGKSEEQRIGLRVEASRWQQSYNAVSDEYGRYRRKRESGIDGFFYNHIGW